MRKIISILLVVLMLGTLMVGCDKNDSVEVVPNDTSKPTNSTTDDSKPDTTTPSTDTNENEGYTVDIVDFDKSVLSLEELGGFRSCFSIIDIPTKTMPNEPIIEQFTTEDEFRQYLNLYGNVEDHSQDSVSIQQGANGTVFNYSHGFTGATSMGFDLDFYFIMHPEMPVGYELDFDETYYDKDSETVYAVLVKEDSIDAEGAQSTFGFVYFSIDEEFAEENKISKVSIMLPEKTEKIILDGSEGNKHGMYEFVQFDKNITNFNKLKSFDVRASIIDIPTSKTTTTSIFEKFETTEQFQNYLSQYGDVLDHSQDVVKIEQKENSVNYTYSGRTTIKQSTGFDLDLYFMMHPDMPVGYVLNIGDRYYDEATGTVYIFIERGSYTDYEDGNGVFIFFDISIDDDFSRENTINKICLVMPE